MRVIIDAKYEKADLHKVMENQCQHLTKTQRNYLIKLLQEIKWLSYGTISTLKTHPVDFKLKEDMKPICPRSYPVPKVHEEMFKREIEHLVRLGFLEVANDS